MKAGAFGCTFGVPGGNMKHALGKMWKPYFLHHHIKQQAILNQKSQPFKGLNESSE